MNRFDTPVRWMGVDPLDVAVLRDHLYYESAGPRKPFSEDSCRQRRDHWGVRGPTDSTGPPATVNNVHQRTPTLEDPFIAAEGFKRRVIDVVFLRRDQDFGPVISLPRGRTVPAISERLATAAFLFRIAEALQDLLIGPLAREGLLVRICTDDCQGSRVVQVVFDRSAGGRMQTMRPVLPIGHLIPAHGSGLRATSLI
jgi:hypothetical protein